MYQLQVWHTPKTRYTFPPNWHPVTATQLVTLTRDGEYWFENLQWRPTVTKIVLTNLVTEERKEFVQPQKTNGK